MGVVARLDVASAMPGSGFCALRVADVPMGCGGNTDGGAGTRLALYRTEATSSDESADVTNLKVWHLGLDSSGEALEFVALASATLQRGRGILDAAFHESGARLMCWMSDLELWDIDLARTAQDPSRQGVDGPELDDSLEAGFDVRSKISKLVGGRATTDVGAFSAGKARSRLYEVQLRTTAAQQAGVLPRFLGNILPAHVPSHLLPPPATLWTGLLSTFGKPPPGAQPQSDVAATMAKASSRQLQESPPTSQARSELVDVAWMDQLVQDTLTRSS